GDHAQRSGRQPRIDQRLCDREARAGRFRRGSGDNRAPCREGGRNLPRWQQRREIPSRERQAHSDWLVDDRYPLLRRTAWNELSANALGFLAIPFELIGRGGCFTTRFRQWLSRLATQGFGDDFEAGAHQIRCAAKDLGAVPRRDSPPIFETARGAGEDKISVGFVRRRNSADYVLGNRRTEGQGLSGESRPPLVVDEEAEQAAAVRWSARHSDLPFPRPSFRRSNRHRRPAR